MENKNRVGICVLVSGGGTNLQALIDACASGVITSGEIVAVISDTEGAYALERAAKAGIRCATVPKKAFAGDHLLFEQTLEEEIEKVGAELIVLAGFFSILSENFTTRHARRIINVHPSLIPALCGKGFYGLRVHEAALARGVKITGATVHFVNEIPDGGEIIMQKVVSVRDGDTPEILQKRVMREAEWVILPEATEKICREILAEKRGG